MIPLFLPPLCFIIRLMGPTITIHPKFISDYLHWSKPPSPPAETVSVAPKSDHDTPLLRLLPWLPISLGVKYKLLNMTSRPSMIRPLPVPRIHLDTVLTDFVPAMLACPPSLEQTKLPYDFEAFALAILSMLGMLPPPPSRLLC